MKLLEKIQAEQRIDRQEQRRHNRRNLILTAISVATAIAALIASIWANRPRAPEANQVVSPPAKSAAP